MIREDKRYKYKAPLRGSFFVGLKVNVCILTQDEAKNNTQCLNDYLFRI